MADLRTFLLIAARHLRRPIRTNRSEFSDPSGAAQLRSWCSWTTYSRLKADAGYWTGELPLETELGESCVSDGGTWGQPFGYDDDLAHVIIPRIFIEEPLSETFTQWQHEQDLEGLSLLLTAAGVDHHLSEYALEVKLF